MRVLVGDVLHAHQVAGLLDVLQNNFVGSPDLKACKLFACFFGQVTAIVHGDNNGNLRVVVDADFKSQHRGQVRYERSRCRLPG